MSPISARSLDAKGPLSKPSLVVKYHLFPTQKYRLLRKGICLSSPDLTWVFMTGSGARLLVLYAERNVIDKVLYKIKPNLGKINIF